MDSHSMFVNSLTNRLGGRVIIKVRSEELNTLKRNIARYIKTLNGFFYHRPISSKSSFVISNGFKLSPTKPLRRIYSTPKVKIKLLPIASDITRKVSVLTSAHADKIGQEQFETHNHYQLIIIDLNYNVCFYKFLLKASLHQVLLSRCSIKNLLLTPRIPKRLVDLTNFFLNSGKKKYNIFYLKLHFFFQRFLSLSSSLNLPRSTIYFMMHSNDFIYRMEKQKY